MQDMNWKNWALVILIVLGLSFELIKRAPKGTLPFNTDSLEATTASVPYSIRSFFGLAKKSEKAPRASITDSSARVSPEQLEAFLAAQRESEATEFAHGKGGEGESTEEIKNESEDEYEYFVDESTGKKYRRKKKKEKDPNAEQSDEAQAPNADVAEEIPEEIPQRETDKIQSAIQEVLTTGAIPAPVVAKKAAAQATSLEEWIQKLLTYPDLEATKVFIDMHNRRQVTTEIYYKVVQLMLDDSREDMKLLGVLAAGLQTSARSFEMLAKTASGESPTSKVRSECMRFLGLYSELSRLAILENILRASSSPEVTVMATQRLDVSVQNNLVKTTAPNSEPGQVNGYSLVPANVPRYERFVSILQVLAESQDHSVAANASSTLNNLQAMLNIGQSTSTASY